jgi:hypothetical protein
MKKSSKHLPEKNMKPFHLRDIRTHLPPYKGVLDVILSVTKERSIELAHGVRGFILGQHVVAPHSFRESLIATKEGHKIVLTYEKTDKWGVSHYLLPYQIPCEPLHFRKERLRSDSYLFRVYRHITLCHAFGVTAGSGMYGLDAPDQFCPVFDRHGHLIGINSGVFCDKLLCIPIQELV